jgi:hypothetical protein
LQVLMEGRDKKASSESRVKVRPRPRGGTEELHSHLAEAVPKTCANSVLMPIHFRCTP